MKIKKKWKAALQPGFCLSKAADSSVNLLHMKDVVAIIFQGEFPDEWGGQLNETGMSWATDNFVDILELLMDEYQATLPSQHKPYVPLLHNLKVYSADGEMDILSFYVSDEGEPTIDVKLKGEEIGE